MDKIEVVEVFIGKRKAGRIVLTEQDICAFEYDSDFIRTGFSLSPYHLPLRSGLYVAQRTPFQGCFGVFADCLPDGWGSLLLDRYLRSKGVEIEKLSVLQRLALVGITGRGALEYFPDNSALSEAAFIDLNNLSIEIEKVLTTGYAGEGLELLYKYGGSSGGVRPKVFVSLENRQWLVKFKTTTDPKDIGKTEYEYSLLAKQCGIFMPETRLFENKYFGAERFDRTDTGKIHTISAAGLLHANYRIPSLDYSVLLKVCLHLTKNIEEVYSLFSRMIFNIVISNRDDHAKNFSFQYKNDAWTLSPAYDILPSAGFNGHHTTTINGQGNPKMKDILQVATGAGLSEKITKTIIEQVTETCRTQGMQKYKI
ncbi:MAG: type II toxin-antitoxin system HipA family toxin [Chitinophagaceae bacterium]|jgi:serine/threonine-protein kinase HipA|nr:type II toxin-antitoxin system HipA family toxin [Chitinophagaceae bacterium]